MRHAILAATVSVAVILSIAAHSQGVAPSGGAAAASSSLKKEFDRGYRLKEQKRAPEAIAVFSGILAKDPGNHAALLELGYLHMALKHPASAVKYLGAASEQTPDDMRLHMDLGYALQALKRAEAAAEQFTIVAGRAGEFQEQALKALDEMKASPGETPEKAKQRRLLESGYGALDRGDKAEAIKAFTDAVVNDPNDVGALKQLAFLDLDAGKLAAASARLEAVRALDPSDYFVALQLGYTYERLQKKERAREAFGVALASGDEKIHGAAKAALDSSGGPAAPPNSL